MINYKYLFSSSFVVFFLLLHVSCSNNDSACIEQNPDNVISISCWGDSKTEGWQDNTTQSYPLILQNMINNLGGRNKVYNMGAHGENSKEILQRQGAIPLHVRSFIMPASSSDTVRIFIDSRLRVPDTGCNPCYIEGVRGTIIKDDTDKTHRNFSFVREIDDDSFVVTDSSQIITDAMLHRRNDILVIDIGYNGGYNDSQELVSQIRMMIDFSFCKEYLVLGRVDHQMAYYELEELFSEEFGERFINLREFYIERGLELNNLLPSDDDIKDMSNGIAPGSLFYDVSHENYYGYFCKAYCVLEKLKEFGLINTMVQL